ncbi:DoxX family protein [Piscinibacter gummiphilus]|uniref:DoxX family protein n=1 Tax=Piscinibacter gummiphilus TaxID=946333 RepID=A0A1W6LIP5_9BURK|nr:DoxX family protein [Piscinibacter gummiphilus]
MQQTLTLAGRILLAWIFLSSGLEKLGALQGTAEAIASTGLPLEFPLAVLVAVFEVTAAAALVVGWYTRAAALALALFTVAASFLFHAYWQVPPAQQHVQQLLFLKNLAITGGLLSVGAFGPGGWSVDARRAR